MESTESAGHCSTGPIGHVQENPSGLLLAWPSIGDQFPDGRSHHAASVLRVAEVDPRLSWEARQAARDWLNTEAPVESREVVARVECDFGEPSDREPYGLC